MSLSKLELNLIDFANEALKNLNNELNEQCAKEELSKTRQNIITLKKASYGQLDGTKADVKWLLESFIFNGVLRLPAGYSILSLFGTKEKSQESNNPFFLEVTAVTSNGTVSTSIEITSDWRLSKDLLLSSAQQTQNVSKPPRELTNLLRELFQDKKGLEIGGPSETYEERNIYKLAESVDLVNFSEKTMWGTFKDGAIFRFHGGGSGVVRITDGSTLEGIPDQHYDFAMGSHYLEHLINPIRALASMLRVLKKGGHMVLILPRKEACFDHLRGTTSLEDVLSRYIHKASEKDMKYSGFEVFNLQNDLSMDPPAGDVEQIRARSVLFDQNRGIHTTVWDFNLIKQVSKVMNCKVVFQSTEGLHQWNILKKM